MASKGLPAHVDVLRPPTFDCLREQLRAKPGFYHVVHFDGHGGYGAGAGELGALPHTLRGSQGCLVFENEQGKPDLKSAHDLSAMLKEHAVPAVVLNACQAGQLDENAEDAFASVATSLLKSGMRSVVAMAYSLYVSGAREFLPAFYGRLFESGDMAEGVRAGRQAMLLHKRRVGRGGWGELEDWLLPVLYQQQAFDFGFAKDAPRREGRDAPLFIGRDRAMLELERALHRRTPAILVRGLGGVGKTTLAKGFVRWLEETGGLDGALWFDFREIRTTEHVINRTGEVFYGGEFGANKTDEKLALLGRALRTYRVVMVWDNFESAATNLTGEDRAALGRLLDAIAGGRGKVLITSRDEEGWLGATRRFALPLGGLQGEERWEYCEAILQELGLPVNRQDPMLGRLLDQLGGHPLAMRAVLPRLEGVGAQKLILALRGNIAELKLNPDEEDGKLFGTLRFVEKGLREDLRPLLGLVGLHEGHLHAGLLEAMAEQVDAGWTRARIDELMAELGAAGLVRDVGQAMYEMHPLLTGYLRGRGEPTEGCQRAYVDVMGRLADQVAPKEEHGQRGIVRVHGANFHFALGLAERLGMEQHFAALTQGLAAFAQNRREFAEASRLFRRLAEHRQTRGDWEGEAAALHQLGRVAQEERDFASAREWYLKSLAITEQQGNLHGAAISYHQLGMVAQEERDFASAREWYLKSLAIEEKQGNIHGAASTYHQLGIVAQEERDFASAREWYLKSLAIKEKQGNIHGAASTYHQLGMVAEEERDFTSAREWYLKSLAISEQQGNLHYEASTYHQLGTVAEEERNFASAQQWYLKSLAISEQQGILHYAASTYHQLGRVAEEERDFASAREWYLKSLAISEQQGNLHGAASTYGQLGRIAASAVESGGWYIRAIQAFRDTNDQRRVERASRDFLITYRTATLDEKPQLETLWAGAKLGPFPHAQAQSTGA